MTKEYCMICGKELNNRQIKRGNHVCSKSCSNKKRYLSQSARDKMSESLRKPEIAKKHKEAILAIVSKPEVRKKLSNKLHAYFANVENRQRLSATLKALVKTEEHRNKISAGIKAGLANVESRKKISDGLKRYFSNENNRKSLSNKIKDKWKQEDYRNSVSLSLSKSLRELYQDEHKKEDILSRSYATRKRNGTLKSSKDEDLAYAFLVNMFSKKDIIRQYRNAQEYPFKCDFYIIPFNLYIEGHFGWYHNGRPFIGNDKDLEELNKLKEKAKTSDNYANKIKQWTDLDVRKRQTAIANNLWFIECYNLQEFKDIIITIVELHIKHKDGKEINYD